MASSPSTPSPSDSIVVGDLTHSVAAIGDGASVIYQQALSAADQAREQAEFEREELAKAVARRAEHLRDQANATPTTEGSPYKHLLHYELPDTARFFGRDQTLNSLLDNLVCGDSRCRFLILHGDSGVGKTSLLQAGVMPALVSAQHLPLYVRLGTSDSPVVSVKQSLMPDLGRTPNLEGASLQGFLHEVAELLPEGKRVFVLLDQFEAFFALPAEARKGFVDELARCLFDDDPRDYWLISVRSSRMGYLNAFQPTIPQPFSNTFVVPPLSRQAAHAAILEPGKLSGLSFDDDLLNALLDDLGGDTIDPSRLQLVCHTLVSRRVSGQESVSLEVYEKAGRVEGILGAYLDTVLEQNLPPDDRESAWHALAAIAERHDGATPVEDVVSALKTYDLGETDVRRVLTSLEANRLLRLDGDGYQLTSASLLPRIRQWAIERAVLQQVRSEVARQVEQVRGSALRGLLGGLVGFSIAYLITFASQVFDTAVLPYLTALRTVPGGLAGLIVILSIDVARASYHGPRRWMRWVVGGLGGAVGFLLAVGFHALLRASETNVLKLLLELAPAGVEGALWGLVAGLGATWVMTTRRPVWLTVPAVTVVSGLALALADFIGDAFGSPTPGALVAVAGAVMPLCVIAAALVARVPGEEDLD